MRSSQRSVGHAEETPRGSDLSINATSHKQSDVDKEATSQHHTLGSKPTQAAPGNHEHDDLGAYKFSAFPPGDKDVKWRLTNGQGLDTTVYKRLFDRMGYTYGGAGTTFNIPNYQDKFPVGVSGTKPIGSSGGAATVTLVKGHIPKHVHTIDHDHSNITGDGGHTHPYDAGGATPGTSNAVMQRSSGAVVASPNLPGAVGTGTHSHDVPAFAGNSGDGTADSLSGTPLPIMPPWLACYIWIKVL